MKNHYKNKIHLEPPQGLINDPNGLSYFNGEYYVFHQWNRFSCNHTYKEWGLFKSKDLLTWEHKGSAILPDSQIDSHGVYSGSAVVAEDKLRIFYTGNTKSKFGRKSYQCLVESEDGQTFIKKSSFETPNNLTEHHRDPKVFYFNNTWHMLIGSQNLNDRGTIALYTSDNLEEWHYQGIFFESPKLEQMCECPDLIDFGEQQVLLACPQKRNVFEDTAISSYSGYYIGKIVNQSFQSFTDFSSVDDGFDFYAPQTFRDPKGRCLMWAWMSRMSEQEEQACPTKMFGYMHCLTMPREVVLENGVLLQKPLEEFLNQRRTLEIDYSNWFIFEQKEDVLLFEVDFFETATKFQMELAEGNVTLTYRNNQLSLKRQSWLDNQMQAKLIKIKEIKKLQAFIDQSSLEIFINNGEKVMSLRYFPKTPNKVHQFNCDTNHKATLSKIEIGEENG
ncbi:glycoside hydrolase family 32 protein [Streptococcus halotolerans]|uniref:glycoside hydrolase family 32 protein n=1 Tax=Streptococcus halotolerans TaxID=1814128 RepID=UPI0009ED2001|nr:glycoside hydrolase family 32 protein [Streptococcus halotolerans]